MTLKLDPRWPLTWRSPTSLQLGVDPAVVVLEDVTGTQERILAALAVGISDSGLNLIARDHADERRDLLEAIAPALLRPTTVAEPRVAAISGYGPLVGSLARTLTAEGVTVLVSERPEDVVDQGAEVAVAVGDFVLHPTLHALWLRRDVPHLPIVFSDTGLVVGPVVEPGAGPCLRCLELHHRDADPAWPAVASQLLGRRRHAESTLLATEGAAVAARLVLQRLRERADDASVSTRIDEATGRRTRRRWHPHPDCGCRGIPSPTVDSRAATRRRRETGWAAAARLAPVPD